MPVDIPIGKTLPIQGKESDPNFGRPFTRVPRTRTRPGEASERVWIPFSSPLIHDLVGEVFLHF